MVLLALLWAAGWLNGADPFKNSQYPSMLIYILGGVFLAWALLSSVIASGFFHAASIYKSPNLHAYRRSALRLVITGLIILFIVPTMAQSLGNSPIGRTLSLFVTAISLCAIIFNRARMVIIENRMREMALTGQPGPAHIEEIEQIGEAI